MTKNNIIAYLREHKADFIKKYQISQLILFGSYSRDENRSDSDVDIAIKTPLCDYFKLYDFKEELENSFNTKVDLVRLRDKMNIGLKKQIEKDGIYV